MSRGTWQECALWLNIQTSQAVAGDELHVAHFHQENVLVWKQHSCLSAFMGAFHIHRHTILSPVRPSPPGFTPLLQLIGRSLSVTWRKHGGPPTQLYLCPSVDVRGSLLVFQTQRFPLCSRLDFHYSRASPHLWCSGRSGMSDLADNRTFLPSNLEMQDLFDEENLTLLVCIQSPHHCQESN